MAYKSQVTITRPANTTAYTAGDVVGGAFQIVGMPEGANRSVMLTSFDLKVFLSSVTSGMTSYTLELFNQKPPSDIADNAAYDLTAADREYHVGTISLGSPADKGATLACAVDQINKHVLTGVTGLWGYLVTNGAYTPTSGEQYMLTSRAIDFN